MRIFKVACAVNKDASLVKKIRNASLAPKSNKYRKLARFRDFLHIKNRFYEWLG